MNKINLYKMKKIIVILITFFAVSNAVNAQVNTGFEVGSNFAFLAGDSTSIKLYHPKPGIYTGIFWDISTGYKNYIQIGGFLSQQGVRYKKEHLKFGKRITDTKRHNIYYIKIPVMWKQSWGDWYTSFGAYGELAAIADSKWTKTIQTADSVFKDKGNIQSFSNHLRQFDTGLSLAFGAQVPLGGDFEFFFKIAYNHGLLAINSKTNRIENKLYNRFFTASVGVIINKSKYKRRR